MNTVNVNGKRINVSKFHDIALAQSALFRRQVPSRLVLGDPDDPFGGYWICRPVDAEKLIRAGYELVTF